MPSGGGAPSFRRARRDDVPAIVRLLADDPLGRDREVASPEPSAAYWRAFDAVDRDGRNLLVVAELDGEVVGTLQLTFIPSLTRQGGERAQVEGVRVDARHRDRGLGRSLLGWAVEQARARGCRLVQLTTDKRRPDALRFYESLGFRATHEGLKLPLEPPGER
jgi:GNAT superfamily N-acetyltransferase